MERASESRLTADERAAVEQARASPSYGLRRLTAPGGQLVVVVGETHLKLRRASELGRLLVGAFALRGVETFPSERVAAGRLTKWLIYLPRVLLLRLSFGLIKDSTIKDARAAKQGNTFLLESVSPVPLALHVGSIYLALFFSVMYATVLVIPFQAWIPDRVLAPLLDLGTLLSWHLPALIPAYLLRRWRWSWILHPLVTILTVRNTTMAEGTVAMLRAYPERSAALVVMGRAHLPGYAQELVEKHGFSEGEV